MRYRPEGLADRLADGSEEPEGLASGADTSDPAAPAAPNGGSTPAGPVRWGLREWLRWTWRQLTSMRVALLLLLLLAVAALPGAFFPQRPQDAAKVSQYYLDHPSLAPVLERLGMFDVYASAWFAAIYLLLFVSLVGCIVPRAADHLRSLRQPPPKAPSRLSRMPVHDAFTVAASPADTQARVAAALRGYRVRTETSGAVVSVSAERGYLREAGNIAFHLALIGLLVSMAYGSLVHYRGQVLVVEGETFANSELAYDSFDAGAWFSPDSLAPFRLTLNSFSSTFSPTGAAEDFTAEVTVVDGDAAAQERTIRVNHPLRVGGATVYLMGNGFAPRVKVYDGAGHLAFSAAVPFIPQDETSYASRGVIKVPDTTTDIQLGLNGWFLPTGVVDEDGNAFSLGPEPDDPVLVLDVWSGDLGLDLGVPQNVYQLDTTAMTQVVDDEGEPVRVVVRPGETVELPDGLGTIVFEDLPRFVGLDLRYDPTLTWVLVFALIAIAGLAASLFLPRRRVFVRFGPNGDGRTVVTAAALARGDDPGLEREFARLIEPVRAAAPPDEHVTPRSTT